MLTEYYCNDYEILYYIREGNEEALKYLFKKYDAYIWKAALSYCKYNGKVEDLVQEGKIILYNCIRVYRPTIGCFFFSFFEICIKREFLKLSSHDYFKNNIIYLNEIIDSTFDYGKNIVYLSDELINEEAEKEMYRFLIMEGFSLKLYAEKKHLSYHKVYVMYARLVEKLKRLL